MQVDWTFDGCDQDEERQIEQLWEGYQAELEAKVRELPIDPSELRLAIAHDSDSGQWELQAALHLPNRTLTAETIQGTVERAFDRVIANLAHEMDEQGDRPTRVERRRQSLEAVLPLLERNRAACRAASFFAFLNPLVRSVRPHAERELDVLELEGTISGESLEPDEVLDEVLLRAWERFNDRPTDVPLDLWLIGLVHAVVEAFAGDVPHESLQEEREVALPEEDEQTSPHTWIEQATYPETIEMGELLPGHPGVDAWDRLDLEARQTKMTRLLSVLTRLQRQTLVLNAVEGYDPETIARLEDRAAEEVAADIKLARRKLAEALAAGYDK